MAIVQRARGSVGCPSDFPSLFVLKLCVISAEANDLHILCDIKSSRDMTSPLSSCTYLYHPINQPI